MPCRATHAAGLLTQIGPTAQSPHVVTAHAGGGILRVHVLNRMVCAPSPGRRPHGGGGTRLRATRQSSSHATTDSWGSSSFAPAPCASIVRWRARSFNFCGSISFMPSSRFVMGVISRGCQDASPITSPAQLLIDDDRHCGPRRSSYCSLIARWASGSGSEKSRSSSISGWRRPAAVLAIGEGGAARAVR